jgi:replicative DNA helicase
MTALRAVQGEGRKAVAAPALEAALCWRIMTDPAEWWSVSGWLRAEHFHDARARAVFDALTRLVSAGATPSLTLVRTELGELDAAWFEGSARGASSVGGVDDLGRIIANAWRIRRAAQVSEDAASRFRELSLAPSRAGEIDDALASMLADFSEVQAPPGRGVTRGSVGLSRPEAPPAHPTGWVALDQQFGWRRGVTYLGIRSGGGKTTFSMQACLNVAMTGAHALYIGVEQAHSDYEAKLEAIYDIGTNKLGRRLDPEAFSRVAVYADDEATLNRPLGFAELEGVIDREQERAERLGSRLGLVVVDYVQHRRLIGPGVSERAGLYDRVSAISDRLRSLGQQRDVPFLATSQFNRNAEEDTRSWPKRSHLLGGSALENDAIAVLLGHGGAKAKTSSELKIRVDKQRHGPAGLTVEFVMHDGAFLLDKD